MGAVKTLLNYAGVFVIYCGISLSVGEWHPFSNFPMYNSFPNWSYSFYLADSSGSVIPWWKAFKVDAGHMAHRYYGICQHNRIAYGHAMETDEKLHFIGHEMLASVSGDFNLESTDDVYLYRRYYFFKGDSLMFSDFKMATFHVKSALE